MTTSFVNILLLHRYKQKHNKLNKPKKNKTKNKTKFLNKNISNKTNKTNKQNKPKVMVSKVMVSKGMANSKSKLKKKPRYNSKTQIIPILNKKIHKKYINFNNKYILVKGTAGFGNMISSLNYCYNIALLTNRKLVIDWKHSLWNDNFNKYFILPNNIYEDYDTFMKKYKTNTNVFPPIFINKLNKNVVDVFAKHNKEYVGWSLFPSVKKAYSNITIVVMAFNFFKIGFQQFNNFWKNIKIHPNIQTIINTYKSQLVPYNSIHIRNTDQQQINTTWITNFLNTYPNKNIYVATDDKKMLELCKNTHTKIFNFTTLYDTKTPLQFIKIPNIYNKNIETIIDIILLSQSDVYKYASKLLIKGQYNSSSFSLLAQKIHDYNHKIPERNLDYVSFSL